eukprot:Selendium_serpulae@DN3922_c0_g1_i2.p1
MTTPPKVVAEGEAVSEAGREECENSLSRRHTAPVQPDDNLGPIRSTKDGAAPNLLTGASLEVANALDLLNAFERRHTTDIVDDKKKVKQQLILTVSRPLEEQILCKDPIKQLVVDLENEDEEKDAAGTGTGTGTGTGPGPQRLDTIVANLRADLRAGDIEAVMKKAKEALRRSEADRKRRSASQNSGRSRRERDGPVRNRDKEKDKDKEKESKEKEKEKDYKTDRCDSGRSVASNDSRLADVDTDRKLDTGRRGSEDVANDSFGFRALFGKKTGRGGPNSLQSLNSNASDTCSPPQKDTGTGPGP